MRKLTATLCLTIAVLLGSVGVSWGADLPVNLKFFMSKHEVINHLKAFHDYEVESGSPNKVVFLVPDTLTKTKIGFFLKFNSDRLVKITSGRYGMKKDYYEKYMRKMKTNISQWKRQGIETLTESAINNMYIYRDDEKYVSVSGAKYKTGFQVEISFTERNFKNRKR